MAVWFGVVHVLLEEGITRLEIDSDADMIIKFLNKEESPRNLLNGLRHILNLILIF